MRELSRIDRAVSTGVRYHWHDDGPETTLDPTEPVDLEHLPAIYCRHCGRGGWMTAYEPGTETPSFTPGTIRKQSMTDRGSVRALISAEQELRARRIRQIRRARLGVRNAADAELGLPARLRRPGAVVLEIDDESPDFHELELHEGFAGAGTDEDTVIDISTYHPRRAG